MSTINIFNSEFILTVISNENNTANIEYLYFEFKNEIITLSTSNLSIIEKFRILKELESILKFQTNYSYNELYIQRAKALVITELELLEKRITHPNLFLNESVTLDSAIKWNEKYSKRDLMELIIALDSIAATTDINGIKLPFSKLVMAFENLFNIKLLRAYKTRSEILNKKINKAGFLKNLVDAVIKQNQNL